MTGIQLDWNDVLSTVKAIQGKLTIIGVILVVMIALLITAVTIPESVTSIGDDAFSECWGLADKQGMVIVRDAVYDCRKDVTSVKIPDGVTSIGDWAFDGCTSLTTVTIPKGVTNIGKDAFKECPNLTLSVKSGSYAEQWARENQIPLKDNGNNEEDGSVTEVKPSSKKSSVAPVLAVGAVTAAVGVGIMMMKPGQPAPEATAKPMAAVTAIPTAKPTAVPGEKYTQNDMTFVGQVDGTLMLSKYYGSAVSVKIPAKVKEIPVTSVGMDAFRHCESLASVTIPEGVTSIGWGAFSACKALSAVTIPEGVTTIGEWAFDGCTSLTSVTIPEGVTNIGRDAFKDCTNLTLSVKSGSYAQVWAKENGYQYEIY